MSNQFDITKHEWILKDDAIAIAESEAYKNITPIENGYVYANRSQGSVKPWFWALINNVRVTYNVST